MKIAILTTFRHMPENFSLVNDVKDQVKTLKKYGHEVVFYAQEGCKGQGIDCTMRAVFPRYKVKKNVVNEEAKRKITKILDIELKEFEAVITHDLMFISSHVTYRDAIKECNYQGKWIHWCHSGVGSRLNIKMLRSKYVYMNYTDRRRFAESIGVKTTDVAVIFNDKDARLFFDWNPLTCEIADKYSLFDRDVMQTYPLCSTRMDAKGVDHVIKIFGKLKELDNKVLLIIPNANAKRKKLDIDTKMALAKHYGLTKDEFVFTSEINKDWVNGMPRQVVRDLMQISNLFIFPSVSEVCSNVLLEASMTKQLLVLNKDFPAMFDFGKEGRTCLGQHFGSLLQANFRCKTDAIYADLAKVINQQLLSSKENLQCRRILNDCNIDTLYKKQLEPLLYESY